MDEQFNKNQKNFFRAQKDIAEGKFNFLYLIEPLEKEVDNENEESDEQNKEIPNVERQHQQSNISFTEIYKFFDKSHQNNLN